MAKRTQKPQSEQRPQQASAPQDTQEPTGINPAPPDPFDPASLRLTDSFTSPVGVKKALLTIPVRKPDKATFVRVHPNSAYRLATTFIELKEERETYLVDPHLRDSLLGESMMKVMTLHTAITRQGDVFLWPVKMPDSTGRADEWSRSAMEATEQATSRWVRVQANMSLGAYDVFVATGSLPEPEWPDTPFRELLRLAFRDKRIDSLDHPVLRKLRGEV